jgi:hypothetical protein
MTKILSLMFSSLTLKRAYERAWDRELGRR